MESWITDASGPRTEQGVLLPYPAGEDDLDDLLDIPGVQRLRTEVAVLWAQLFAAELIASERAERIADMRLVLAALRDVLQGGPVRHWVEPVVPEPPAAEVLEVTPARPEGPPAPPPGEGPGWIDWEPPGRSPESDEPEETDSRRAWWRRRRP